MRVSVAYSPSAGLAEEIAIEVADGATLLDALQASGLLARHPEIDLASRRVGVWGVLPPLDARLRAGDRAEIYRPLQVDPMEARRLRQRRQMNERNKTRGADARRRDRAGDAGRGGNGTGSAG